MEREVRGEVDVVKYKDCGMYVAQLTFFRGDSLRQFTCRLNSSERRDKWVSDMLNYIEKEVEDDCI